MIRTFLYGLAKINHGIAECKVSTRGAFVFWNRPAKVVGDGKHETLNGTTTKSGNSLCDYLVKLVLRDHYPDPFMLGPRFRCSLMLFTLYTAA